jgi:hypothetical protein
LLARGPSVLHYLLHRTCFRESTSETATMCGLALPTMNWIYLLSKYACVLRELVCAIVERIILAKTGTDLLAHDMVAKSRGLELTWSHLMC